MLVDFAALILSPCRVFFFPSVIYQGLKVGYRDQVQNAFHVKFRHGTFQISALTWATIVVILAEYSVLRGSGCLQQIGKINGLHFSEYFSERTFSLTPLQAFPLSKRPYWVKNKGKNEGLLLARACCCLAREYGRMLRYAFFSY